MKPDAYEDQDTHYDPSKTPDQQASPYAYLDGIEGSVAELRFLLGNLVRTECGSEGQSPPAAPGKATGQREVADNTLRERPGKKGRCEEAENVFQKDSDTWTVRYGGKTVSGLKDVKGMMYIAHLLGHPNENVSAVDLRKLTDKSADSRSVRSEPDQRH